MSGNNEEQSNPAAKFMKADREHLDYEMSEERMWLKEEDLHVAQKMVYQYSGKSLVYHVNAVLFELYGKKPDKVEETE